jgi:pre-mRNA-splicing factor ATP-dependent RNA helicase DHX15/PRP43
MSAKVAPRKKIRLEPNGGTNTNNYATGTQKSPEELENGPNNLFTGRAFTQNYFKILQKRRQLPVHQQRNDVLQLVQRNQITILVGETGSGKTTQ